LAGASLLSSSPVQMLLLLRWSAASFCCQCSEESKREAKGRAGSTPG
jgi:hypothetical protein